MASGHSRRLTRLFSFMLMIVLIIISAFLFSTPIRSSNTLFIDAPPGFVFMQFVQKIAIKTPAGRYYSDLFGKHYEELSRIYWDQPEHADEVRKILTLYKPGLEALLIEEGNTIRITEEQVEALGRELEWLTSVASPDLQEDIIKGRALFPSTNYIGMTMNEAWNYINSNWTPQPEVTAPVPETTTGTSYDPPPSFCLAGYDETCQNRPSLVNGSSQWAYYVYNGFYFEYPADWQVILSAAYNDSSMADVISILPMQGYARGEGIKSIILDLYQRIPIENWDLVAPSILSMEGCPDNQWKLFLLPSIQGIECLQSYQDTSGGILSFYLYQEEQKMALQMRVSVADHRFSETTNDLNAINDMFPDIWHMVESVRMWRP